MRIYIVLVAIVWHIAAYAAENARFDLTIDAYAAPVSIHAFTDDWHDELKSGDSAFLHGLAELSVENEQRKLSMLWRYDYLLDFDERTARLYHAYANDYAPDANSQYPLHINANYSESYGVKWLQKFHFRPNIEFGMGLSLLKGYKITDGELNGSSLFKQAGFKVKDVEQANIDVDYHYDEPQLQEDQLDWHPRNPSALGFSIDTTLKWQLSPQLLLNAQINDLYGRLYWQNIPRTRYDISCQCTTLQHNIDGQLAIDKQYTQNLLPHGSIQLAYHSPENGLAELKTSFSTQTPLTTLAGGYQLHQLQSLMLWEPQTHAFGLELRHPYWRIRWLTDDLNTNQAHRLGLTLAVNRTW